MKDFRPAWKTKAHNKQITFNDVIQRAILIGMTKGETFEDQVRIAESVLDRSTSPHKTNGYGGIARQLGWVYPNSGLSKDLEMTEEEAKQFVKIKNSIKTDHFGKYRSYILLFGELIPEQALVQGMHAALQMGERLTKEGKWPTGVDGSNLHFVILKGEEDDQLLLKHTPSAKFFDNDYHFDEDGFLVESQTRSLKTVMTYPVPSWKKNPFEGRELLRL